MKAKTTIELSEQQITDIIKTALKKPDAKVSFNVGMGTYDAFDRGPSYPLFKGVSVSFDSTVEV